METFKYEPHFHTGETSFCGKVNAKEAVRMYHDAGYIGIIVTDHYHKAFFERHPFNSWDKKIDLYLDGYRKALAEGKMLGMDVFLGMEIRFIENENDYLVFGFDEDFLYNYKELHMLGLKAFRELTADKGIIIIQAHPFRPNMIPELPPLIDGVEVYNGNARHNSANHLVMQYALDNGLKMLSGSDFHQPEDAARGGIILSERMNIYGFIDAVKHDRILDYIQTE